MNNRQKLILNNIIELNIKNGEPVGSKTLIREYKLDISSATVRNEMSQLEKEGYIEKAHTSGGRIPSKKGYDFFARQSLPTKNNALEQKLKDIFAHRRSNIDFTLDEAAKTISEIAEITVITSDGENDELMKSIQLTPIDDSMATIVIVTSSGRVESKIIQLNKFTKINDVRVAVRLFKERLTDTKLKNLAEKVESLVPILANSIKNYESLIQQFVGKIFDFHKNVSNKVYGNKNIIKSDIKREDLAKLLELMQTKSIFSSIEKKKDEDEKIHIDVRPNNTSILSTRIKHHNKTTEVSIVGSNRMNYRQAKNAIELLERFLGEDE